MPNQHRNLRKLNPSLYYIPLLGWRFDIRCKHIVKAGNFKGPPTPASAFRTLLNQLPNCFSSTMKVDVLLAVSACDHLHCSVLVLPTVNVLNDPMVNLHLKGGWCTGRVCNHPSNRLLFTNTATLTIYVSDYHRKAGGTRENLMGRSCRPSQGERKARALL